MADHPLKEQLKAWGRATATRHASNEDGPSVGDSPLARQRELGMRSRMKREMEHEIVGRDGGERRRFMAAKLVAESGGKLRITAIPMWAVDPIPSRNDADRPRDLPRAQVDLGIPDDLMWIERAYIQLKRQHPVRAACLYEEFCTPGPNQEAKAKRVATKCGLPSLSKQHYRRELEKAMLFLDHKRAA